MDPLSKALSDGQRSYLNAKAAVASRGDALLAERPTGAVSTRSDLHDSHEQYRHFHSRVFACVRAIAQQVAGQPITVVRDNSKGEPIPVPNHPLLEMLADPNELMTAWSLMFTTVANLELTGRCLWYVPSEQMILPIPTTWLVNVEGRARFERFLIRPPGHAGEPIPVASEQAVYFHYPSPSDPFGAQSPLQAAGYAVDADVSIQVSQRSAFEHGIHPSVALLVGQTVGADGKLSTNRPILTNKQQKQILEAVRSRYAGSRRDGRALILDGLITDIKKLSLTPNEMDWLNSSDSIARRIYQVFGCNEIILGEVQNGNRAAATAAEDHFYGHTINPKLRLLSECMTEWLGPRFLRDRERVQIEPCVAHDADLELRQWQLGLTSGVVTGNEYRTHVLGLPETDWFAGTGSPVNELAAAVERVVDSSFARLGAQELTRGIRDDAKAQINGKRFAVQQPGLS